MQNTFEAPLDVPQDKQELFLSNFNLITRGTGKLFLMAGDQKIEHLNDDFVGSDISLEDAEPKHLFEIASKGKVGALATQRGLIAEYGADFSDIPYIVKMNSKTNLKKDRDPASKELWDIDDLNILRTNGLKIVGVAYTILFGSEFEEEMLAEAGKLIADAHAKGMILIIYAYLRGKAVKDERDPHLIAGIVGVSASLGADFVKINAPQENGVEKPELLKESIKAAGKTKVIVSGGEKINEAEYISRVKGYLNVGASGVACGRNLHQRSLAEAVKLAQRLSTLIYS